VIECVRCARAVADGYVCRSCTGQLADDLRTLAWLADELEVTRTRQDRVAERGPASRGAGSPLGGFRAHAHGVLRALNLDLAAGWARDLWVEPTPPPAGVYWVPEPPLRGTGADACRWLARQVHRVRVLPGVEGLAASVERHTEAALAAINPVADEQAYGVCGEELDDDGRTCTAHLYGPPGVDWVRCRVCETQHDTRRRTDALERRMRGMYFRPATLARVIPRFTDRPVSAGMIRKWVWEGRAIRAGVDRDGHQVLHVGDVLAVAESTPVRNRGRKAG
jgi:hypothetical protein